MSRQLRESVAKLGAQEQIAVVQADALQWLRQPAGALADIVFIDPPFADGLWEAVIAGLPSHLAADAWLYVESPADRAPKMPAPWLLHREGGTREVRFALYRRATATLSPDQHA